MSISLCVFFYSMNEIFKSLFQSFVYSIIRSFIRRDVEVQVQLSRSSSGAEDEI